MRRHARCPTALGAADLPRFGALGRARPGGQGHDQHGHQPPSHSLRSVLLIVLPLGAEGAALPQWPAAALALSAPAAFCRWCSANASRSFCDGDLPSAPGVRMIWRDSTTAIVPVGSRRKSSIVRPKRDLHVLDGGREVGTDLRRALHAERRDRVADEAAGLDEPGARARLHRAAPPPPPRRSAGRCAARRRGSAAGTSRPPPRQHQHRQRLRLRGREVEVRHHGVGDQRRAGP